MVTCLKFLATQIKGLSSGSSSQIGSGAEGNANRTPGHPFYKILPQYTVLKRTIPWGGGGFFLIRDHLPIDPRNTPVGELERTADRP